MHDLGQLANYRENNRLEAKLSLGGLPESIWETYSAFANTCGGVILLGVAEHRDKTLHAVDLPCPEGLISELWDALRDPHTATPNILSEEDVTIETVDGKRIVVIRVPIATAAQRPVYIGGNPYTGSYCRNGEGDYRLAQDEVERMLRAADAAHRKA